MFYTWLLFCFFNQEFVPKETKEEHGHNEIFLNNLME